MRRWVTLLLVWAVALGAAKYHYAFKKMQTGRGHTLLVIGGIHGNEPGGYFAPMFLWRYYKITEGNVWVIPNLNRDSILQFQRGIYGDMNRKFTRTDERDPDYAIVQEVKRLISAPEVDLVLNLHDGHGFYRSEYKNDLFNPKAWGQVVDIDQRHMAGVKFGNLEEIARQAIGAANVSLQEDPHEFNVKNTQTSEGDREMQQALTFWAISKGKPAFAIETSKNISDLSVKVFYQLKTIERFMEIMGIRYERSFELSIGRVAELIKDHGRIVLGGGRTVIDLKGVASRLSYLPLNGKFVIESDNPLITARPAKEAGRYDLYDGYLKVTSIGTYPVEYDNSLKSLGLSYEGERREVLFGSTLQVRGLVTAHVPEGYRVNAIGFSLEGVKNEEGVPLSLREFDRNYAIDAAGRKYRLEVYRQERFCGTIIVEFLDAMQGKS